MSIHRDGKWYVAMDPMTGVASQGKSVDEALKNFQEAFELWFEHAEDWEKEKASRFLTQLCKEIEYGRQS